jgi:gamma-glutamyltranspeptidase/glutathione hydrolase
VAAKGVVAAGHAATAAAGTEVLAEGGNAVDAALACLCAAAVAEPVLASLGGGGFLVCRMTEGRHAGRTRVYDFFAQTPTQRRSDVDVRTVHADFGPTLQSFRVGLGTIATPGAIRGLALAAEDLGRLPLRRLVEPACTLARTGVRIDAMQAYIIGVVAALLNARPDSAALFASPGRPGALIGEGEVFRLPDYADALEILAIEGADLFYRGEMGRRLADDCEAHGGHLLRADLERYRVERRSPVTIDRFGARVHLNPPPAIGGLLIAYALAVMPADELAPGAFGSPAHLRNLVATLAEADEARLRLPLDRLEEAASVILAPAALTAGRERLSIAPIARRGTTHISVIDGNGNAAALSLSNGEGSSYVLPGTGIILNNMLGEDDLCPDGADAWPLDQRMSSMMAPSLIERADGSLIALGSGGSTRIRAAILQVILNHLVLEESLARAVERPRLHLESGKLSYEPGFPEASLASLSGFTRELDPWPAKNLFFGGVHAAMRDRRGLFTATGDERRGGAVAHA